MCINWSTIGHKLTLCITAMAVCGHRLGLKIASAVCTAITKKRDGHYQHRLCNLSAFTHSSWAIPIIKGTPLLRNTLKI